MYKLDPSNNFVIRLIDGASIPFVVGNRDYEEYLLWLCEGNTPMSPEKPDTTLLLKQGAVAIQQAMDAVAQTRGYDDIRSACAYANPAPIIDATSPLFERCERFRAEGNALQKWMAQTWASAYAYLELVEKGQKPMPTPDEAVAMIPVFIWSDSH